MNEPNPEEARRATSSAARRYLEKAMRLALSEAVEAELGRRKKSPLALRAEVNRASTKRR